MKSFFRKMHRWLGLLMALQIVAWTGSGLYFSIVPIETIRGEHLTRPPETLAGTDFSGLVPLAVARDRLVGTLEPGAVVEAVTVQARDRVVHYRMSGTAGGVRFTRLVDATTGEPLPPLDSNAALETAQAALVTRGTVAGVDWVDSLAPGAEARGRDLPLWRVRFEAPESLNLYVDPWTGDIAARRTARWRIFDFLWMLHIMDFDERDDFNSPLLQVAASLGLLVALSGIAFWAMTTKLLRRRRAGLNGLTG